MRRYIYQYIYGLSMNYFNGPSINICHSEPGAWIPQDFETSECPLPDSIYNIGRTMFETDRIPYNWEKKLNSMDEVFF